MDLLTGFATIIGVIAVGTALAHAGIVDVRAMRSLADVSYFAAAPALMLLTISRVELDGALTANLAASAASLLAAGGTYVAVARLVWRLDLGRVLIGALSSSYVNAGNLGFAVAAYVVGDPTIVVPTLLLQLLVIQPLALAALDRRAERRAGEQPARPWRRMLTNPITLGGLGGLVLAATGWSLPGILMGPVELLAGLAIPAMLIAYGASLRLNPPVGRSGNNREVALVVPLKLVVQPLVAGGVALALGLDGRVLLGVVITAALPTAQNIFMHATRYRVGEGVARESILLTTLLCLPVTAIIALALG